MKKCVLIRCWVVSDHPEAETQKWRPGATRYNSDHFFHFVHIRRLGDCEARPEIHERFKALSGSGREVVEIPTGSRVEVDVAVAGGAVLPVLIDEHVAKGRVYRLRNAYVLDVDAVPAHQWPLPTAAPLRCGGDLVPKLATLYARFYDMFKT